MNIIKNTSLNAANPDFIVPATGYYVVATRLIANANSDTHAVGLRNKNRVFLCGAVGVTANEYVFDYTILHLLKNDIYNYYESNVKDGCRIEIMQLG